MDVALARTAPATSTGQAIVEVETLYLDMIAAAKQYIYIESQYFTAKDLGEALAARLAEPLGPEVVVVLRLGSSGWLEAPTMTALRTVLLQKLHAADVHGRFQAWYADLPGETGYDLHSKLMIVDDEWLRVGSANFSNRSMGFDTECDLSIEVDGPTAERGRAAIGRLRGISSYRRTSTAWLIARRRGAAPKERRHRCRVAFPARAGPVRCRQPIRQSRRSR